MGDVWVEAFAMVHGPHQQVDSVRQRKHKEKKPVAFRLTVNVSKDLIGGYPYLISPDREVPWIPWVKI